VKPLPSQSAPAGAKTISAAVLARAVVRADGAALKSLRQSPGPAVGDPLPANFLKHADEQTVAGVAAMLRAANEYGIADADFTRWGVLAAPRFLARAMVAQAVKRFGQEGAWGVSPHLIPHRSLHSVSGTVSQALHLHGPNFGVGGGPWGAAKALLAAAAMLECDRLPGVWVILTGWNWEPGLDLPEGHTPGQPGAGGPRRPRNLDEPPTCSAVAMALVLGSESRGGTCWRIGATPVAERSLCENTAVAPVLSLESVCEAFETSAAGPRAWRLQCGGTAVLENVEAIAEKRA
jgi:hypothetical protein